MCLEGCKKGFVATCRSFIGVDGCHLKIKFGGQLLIVVGRDPNGIYPVGMQWQPCPTRVMTLKNMSIGTIP